MKRLAVFGVLAGIMFGCAPAAAPSGEPEGAPAPTEGAGPVSEPASGGAAAPSEPADASPRQSGTRTIWDGVYTFAQAREGERVAQSQCTLCHSPQIEWPLVLESWSNRPLVELYEMIRNTMPQTNPGGLTRKEYADILAYMLQLTEAPPGAEELPSSDEGLSQIMVTRR